jgi:hypothetical protein
MNKKSILLSALALSFGFASQSNAQARVQVIHNSADVAAATVDVRVDGTFPDASFDDMDFRTASPFIDVAAGTYTVTINDPSSIDASAPLFSKSLTLVNGETYVVMASGIVSGTGYSPDNMTAGFDLHVLTGARETSMNGMMETDLVVYHGATDAPTVDVVNVTNPVMTGVLVDDASYEDFSAYLELPTADYAIQVRTTDQTTVQEYSAPLSTLMTGGAALTVFASGFLDPTMNSNGEAFGLFAATPTGAVVALPEVATPTTARLQVIHNSAATDAAIVDVWVNDAILLIDDFNFQDATAFIDVPAGVALDIDICASNSTDATSPLFTKSLTLNGGEKYIAVASGTIGSGTYTPATPFDLLAVNMARESATSGMMNTDVMIVHGSTDAPTVNVANVTDPLAVGNIAEGASYGDFTPYIELPNADYILQIRTTDNTTVKEYAAPLQTAGAAGASVTVLASGFLDPTMNNSGAAFGLIAVLADGTVIPLTETMAVSTARLQVVHNCAAIDAATVDVWVNDAILLVDDFDFRTATPFIDVPAGTNLEIDICASGSVDASTPLYTQTINLMGGEKYVAVASGTIGSGTYSPATAFNIIAFNGARESSTTPGNVDVMVFHGATDAPAVDVNEMAVPAGTIVTNIAYGENQGYLDLGASNYVLGIAPTGNANIAQFEADLSGLADSAITVFASGFLDPTMNNSGPAFGLYVSIPTGGPLLMLPSSTLGVDENESLNFKMYPNPTNTGAITLELGYDQTNNTVVTIYDLAGKNVYQNDNISTTRLEMNLSGLNKGTYIIQVQDNKSFSTQKVIVQ